MLGGNSPVIEKTPEEYRDQSDYHSLMSAAEVMADRIRLHGAVRQYKKEGPARGILEKMLAFHRRNGAFGNSGVVKIKRGRGPFDVADRGSASFPATGVTAVSYEAE